MTNKSRKAPFLNNANEDQMKTDAENTNKNTSNNGSGKIHADECQAESFPGEKKIGQKCKVCSGFEDKIIPAQIKEFMLEHCNFKNENFLNLSSILDTNWKDILETEKHDIVVKMSEMMHMGPKGLGLAETLFDNVKYLIARYVIRFEFNKNLPLSTQLALWLDMKLMPEQKDMMEKIINQYFGNFGKPEGKS
jgi:hypothetical protein